MDRATDAGDALALVADRIDVLELLDEDRRRKRAIVDELGYSRSTVNRAISRLADAGLVDDAPRGCRTTFFGSLVADLYREYVESVAQVVDGRKVLEPLSPSCDLAPAVLVGAKTATPGGSSPYEPYYAVEEALQRPGPDGRVRMYVPAFTNPHGLELAQAMAAELPIEIVFGEELLAELRDDFPEDLERLFGLEKFTGFRSTDGPEYTVVVADAESGSEVVVVTHTRDRKLGGVIVNDDESAVRWARERYAEIRERSERLDGRSG